jgi:hypothetical protein
MLQYSSNVSGKYKGDAAFWLVRPDGHIIWTVLVCVKIGGSSYLAWSGVARKGVILRCGAHCYVVRTAFTLVGRSLRWLDHGQFLEPLELESAEKLVLSVQDLARWGFG